MLSDTDYATSTQGEGRCPRCGEGPLKAWYELSEADFTTSERAARHLFCTRCWFEDTAGAPRTA
jgi:hypothetical protein